MQLPGREGRLREAPFTRIEPLVQSLAAELPFAELPFAFSADAEVDGSLVSANLEECGGQGYVRFTAGNPLTTVPGIVGTATLLAGVLGLLFTARPTLTYPG